MEAQAAEKIMRFYEKKLILPGRKMSSESKESVHNSESNEGVYKQGVSAPVAAKFVERLATWLNLAL